LEGGEIFVSCGYDVNDVEIELDVEIMNVDNVNVAVT